MDAAQISGIPSILSWDITGFSTWLAIAAILPIGNIVLLWLSRWLRGRHCGA